jgi:hypothetical protein
MKVAKYIIGIAVLVMAQLAAAQQQQPMSLGENTKLNAGGLFTFGYQGDYGDAVPSSHGLDLGFDGKVSGYYYNPNFLSFTVNPYYDQSRADSSYQSLTGSNGVNATANFFSGSKFPGSVTYSFADNSTGTLGLTGQPNFTTMGKSQGFGVNWSVLLPNLPTISVGYSQGSGNSTLYGTSEEDNSSTRLFNLHSNYQIAGFRLNAFFNHNSLNSEFPSFLTGDQPATLSSSDHDFGFSGQHALPEHGSVYVTYNRASAASNYLTSDGQDESASNTSTYTDSTETANASFHPTPKLSWNVTQSYTNNLNGYVAQNIGGNGGPVPGLDLGSGSYSSTFSGGATYNFTNFLSSSVMATYYDQHYFGQSYTGEYLAGTLNYGKRLWDTFTFSGSIIESSSGVASSSLGLIGNVNYFHRFGGWQTSGQFSYAQNVQTILITYTTSYYSYTANVRHRVPGGLTWIAAFNGNHSGLTQDQGTSSHSESYSTSLSMRRVQANSFFTQSSGISLLGAGGVISPVPTPGLTDYILFTGSAYGGGFAVTPVSRLSISGTFSRALSNTLSTTDSHNNTEIYNAQLQYHLRRIGLLAGYTRFTQGISLVGAPVNSTSYFVGMTRWFNFF